MRLSGEEIQRNLREFVARWADYTGTEKSEAQTFLNQLFECFGTDRRVAGAEFEFYVPTAGGFMDLHWPEVCLVEMKAPTVRVETAQQQVERYWRATSDLAHGRRAARFIVICNFRRFEVWEYGTYPDAPVTAFDLADLPDRYDALAFLAGPSIEPTFTEHHRELTQDAAQAVASVFASLVERSAAPPDEIQSFVLQSVWCMFAEDLGLLDGYPFQATLNEVRSQPSRSAAEIGFLFRVLNQKGNHNRSGRLAGTTYVNGDLFSSPAEVGLERAEIDMLLEATAFDWRKVNPTIFGSLLEGVLGKERRWEIGAHYTHEVDIMKIVGPTIVRPWREQMMAATSPVEARAVLDSLCRFAVLDPACGCGNFLYVAYRELRALEHELKQTITRLATETGLPAPAGPTPYYPLTNLQGIDIERSAVEIAKVTLWMGHRQMIDLYGPAENPLPLQSLTSIVQADALRVPWPATDCIIGNPPFVGDRLIRGAVGGEYVDWLKRGFGVGVVDLCAYWFRLASEHLGPEQRAGLVSTNTLRENKHRRASLTYLVERGGVITDAVSNQKWPGDANVHVSITNWVHRPVTPPGVRYLDGVRVPYISTRLRDAAESGGPPLGQNGGRSFIGAQPSGPGFLIGATEAATLLADDASNAEVVRPYLTSDDLLARPDQSPGRWAVDFGLRSLEDASRFPGPLSLVRERVRPGRQGAARHFEKLWWQFAWPRPEMRSAVATLDRFIVHTLTGKRLALAWAHMGLCPSNLVGVIALSDDYSMGVLLSRTHGAWALAESSSRETRLRYTPSSVFETFPWPDPVARDQRERVAEASRRLLARRTEICLGEQIGLTTLYNAVDDGAWTDLVALHRALDEAVTACYGWPRRIAQDDRELVSRLTALNREIVEGGRPYQPFG